MIGILELTVPFTVCTNPTALGISSLDSLIIIPLTEDLFRFRLLTNEMNNLPARSKMK